MQQAWLTTMPGSIPQHHFIFFWLSANGLLDSPYSIINAISCFQFPG
jgi:hypothetical protein